MNKTRVLRGKIARIVDRRTFIINLGSDEGVRAGTTFVIQGEPEEIRDPDTKQVLGTITAPKGELAVSKVMPHMCVANPKRTVGLSDWLSYQSWGVFEKEERISVRESDIKPLGGGPVKVGDVVIARISVEEAAPEPEEEAADF